MLFKNTSEENEIIISHEIKKDSLSLIYHCLLLKDLFLTKEDLENYSVSLDYFKRSLDITVTYQRKYFDYSLNKWEGTSGYCLHLK